MLNQNRIDELRTQWLNALALEPASDKPITLAAGVIKTGRQLLKEFEGKFPDDLAKLWQSLLSAVRSGDQDKILKAIAALRKFIDPEQVQAVSPAVLAD